MSDYESCVIDPGQFPVFEALDGSREVQGLISAESCDAQDMAAGLWWLHPGEQCDTDIHPDASEICDSIDNDCDGDIDDDDS